MKKSSFGHVTGVLTLALMGAFSLFGQGRGWAQSSYTWQGSTTGWLTPGNWTPSGPPNSSSATAVFDDLSSSNSASPAGAQVGAVIFNADALAYTISTGTLTIDSGSSGAITLNGSSNLETISSVIAGSHGETISGAGTLALTGANTFTGGVSIANTFVEINGNLTASTNGNLGNNASITMSGGATLDSVDSGGNETTTMAISVSGQTVFQNDSAGGANKQFNLNGGISGSGTITINAGASTSGVSIAGTVTNDTFAGTIDVNGILIDNTAGTAYTSGSSGALGLSAIVMGGTGTLTILQNAYIGSLAGSGSGSSLSITSGKTLNVGGDGTTTSFAGIISGSGAFNKIGGTLTLSNANTFTGATSFSSSGGVLVLTNNLALQDSDLVTTNLSTAGSTYVSLSSVTTPTFGGVSGAVNLASAISGYSSVTSLTFSPQGVASNSYTGVIADGATGMNLVMSGASGGTQILSGSNTYTGSTTVNSGNLKIGGTNTTNTGATGSLSNTSGLTINGGNLVFANITANAAINNSATVNLNGGTMSELRNGTTPATLGIAETMGALTLTSGSVIDFGSGTTVDHNRLTFSNLTNTSAVALTVDDWLGSANLPSDSGSNDQLLFTSNTNLATEASSIAFYSGNGTGFLGDGSVISYNGEFEIVPNAVPEPGTWALLLTGLALSVGMWRLRGRRAEEASAL